MIGLTLALALSGAMPICPTGPRDNCVHDGDTFWFEGEKFRIAVIDTPELNGRCLYERRLAIRARNRLADLMGTAEGFELARHGSDPFGRTLVTVTVNGRDIGQTLMRESLAKRWKRGQPIDWCEGR